MTSEEKNKLKDQDILEEMEEEIEEIEKEENEIKNELLEETKKEDNSNDILARTMADFENFKKRVNRDKQDMIFYLKSDILKKILPRVDDLERIIKNTPKDLQSGALFEGIKSLETKLKKDLNSLGVEAFDSIGTEVDPHKHDVMTTIPGQKEGIIFEEFEKGYTLGDKILRHAKVVVGAGE